MRIALAGGPGCGKTSLARQLTTEMYNNRGVNFRHVSEFARDYIDANRDRALDLVDQSVIFLYQCRREDHVPKGVSFVTDAPIFTPIVFTLGMRWNWPLVSALMDMWLERPAYDHVFFLEREKPYLLDGTRRQSEAQAKELDTRIRAFLDLYGVPYTVISGTDEERLNEICSLICDPVN